MKVAIRFVTILSVCGLGLLWCADATAIDWPVWPDSTWHAIGNTHGTYQCYGSSCTPYMHHGTDILAPAGTPVYSVTSGYVKYLDVVIPGNDKYWCLVIGDSSGTEECNAWAYLHMDGTTIFCSVGDTIAQGQLLGLIVAWSPSAWDHLHFTEVRSQGDSAAWDDRSEWRLMTNALDVLAPITDLDAPVFENAYGSDFFAFAANNTDIYFSSGASLSGDVDIICKVSDYVNHASINTAPYKLEYHIAGDSSIPWINSVCFTGEVISQTLKYSTDIIYQNDATCYTWGDYDKREFYFNVTNTDGDSALEISDKDNCWQTTYFHNGLYTVSVRAYDAYGNMTAESMSVSIANYFELSGTILVANPLELDETIITVVSSGQSDTTDGDGNFNVSGVGGGSQLIEISQDHYESVDTVLMMSENQQINLTLTQLCSIAMTGDVNASGDLTSADIIGQVNFTFKSGLPPLPCQAAGDVNCDGSNTAADIIYMVNYVFKGGPPACDVCTLIPGTWSCT